jgi:hypothetical protein
MPSTRGLGITSTASTFLKGIYLFGKKGFSDAD